MPDWLLTLCVLIVVWLVLDVATGEIDGETFAMCFGAAAYAIVAWLNGEFE